MLEEMEHTSPSEYLKPIEPHAIQAAASSSSEDACHVDPCTYEESTFVDQEIFVYIQKSQCLRLILQALGACEVTEDLETEVQRFLELSRAERLDANESPLDFSYLVDVDHERSSALIRFEVDTEKKIVETLYLIELVLESCVEAGASMLKIELADGDFALLLSGMCSLLIKPTYICSA